MLGAYSYIRNGITAGYPFIEAYTAFRGGVQNFVILDGESDDGTWEILKQLQAIWPELTLQRVRPIYLDQPKDRRGRLLGKMFEQARQALQTPWQVMVQADCVFHAQGVAALRMATARAASRTAAFKVVREQFRWNWQEMYWKTRLNLCVRRDRARVWGDALDCAIDGSVDLRLCPLFEQYPVIDSAWCFWENLIGKVKVSGEIWPDKQEDDQVQQFRWYNRVTGRDFVADWQRYQRTGEMPDIFSNRTSTYQHKFPASLKPWLGQKRYDAEKSLVLHRGSPGPDWKAIDDDLAGFPIDQEIRSYSEDIFQWVKYRI